MSSVLGGLQRLVRIATATAFFKTSHRVYFSSLMELWSLMHFLMPHIFASHREFKEWFANPLSGMVEGSHEYNEKLVRALFKKWNGVGGVSCIKELGRIKSENACVLKLCVREMKRCSSRFRWHVCTKSFVPSFCAVSKLT